MERIEAGVSRADHVSPIGAHLKPERQELD